MPPVTLKKIENTETVHFTIVPISGFIFLKSKWGNEVVQIGAYKYYRAGGNAEKHRAKKRWVCSGRKKVAAFTVSRFGKPVIEFRGERFYKNSGSRGTKLLWRCVKARSRACRATLHTIFDKIYSVNNNHSH
ncbi:unnamed protein product [Pieris macdunnoughi]|uniref:FLYWCH-type domain-containing protein n=1 Tax=Pieris macdunnoughi TaxID=345717 RepID=A0A821Q8A1_9NEOP|nr:unnamed protein product [Pieris macdunnoughi]